MIWPVYYQWKRLQLNARRSVKDVLLDPSGPHDISLRPRRPVLRLRSLSFEDDGVQS